MTIISPTQRRSIDSHSENRYSSVINTMSRIITNGEDCIVFDSESFRLEWTSYKTIIISKGLVYKDDVFIHVLDAYEIDFCQSKYYIDYSGAMNAEGEYYIVLKYDYSRSNPSPKATFKIIRNTSIYYSPRYRDNYIYIGSVIVSYNPSTRRYEITSVYYYSLSDNTVYRKIPKGDSIYCDGGILTSKSDSVYPEDISGLLSTDVGTDYVYLSWDSPKNDNIKLIAIYWSSSNSTSRTASLVSTVLYNQTGLQLLKEFEDGYYFVMYLSTSNTFGNYSTVHVNGRSTTHYIKSMKFSKYNGTLTNGIWIDSNTAVIKSKAMAESLGWELFDKMVPYPYDDIQYFNNSSFVLPSGVMRTTGYINKKFSPNKIGNLNPLLNGVQVDYGDNSYYHTSLFSTSDDSELTLGFNDNSIDVEGNYYRSYDGYLEFMITAISSFSIVRNDWGDVRFDWTVINQISGDTYVIKVYDMQGQNIIWQSQTTNLYMYFTVDESVPLFEYPPTYLIVSVESENANAKLYNGSVSIDNSFVKHVLVWAGQSNAYGHFSELSGTNARHDLVSAYSTRNLYAEYVGSHPAEVIPLNASLGSSAADKLADDNIESSPTNYWYDIDEDADGPRLLDFISLVSPLASKVRGIIWSQGENDASAADMSLPHLSTTTRFKLALNKIFDRMRDIIPENQANIIIQILGRSYWNGEEASGVTWQNYRNAEREIVSERADVILGSWVDGAERFSGYVPETGNPGAIHYISSVYHTAASKLANSLFSGTDLINDPPSWVDMVAITGLTAIKDSTGDIIVNWDSGSYSHFKIINIHLATGEAIYSNIIDTNSYVFSYEDQVSTYGYGANYIAIKISGYYIDDDVESPVVYETITLGS